MDFLGWVAANQTPAAAAIVGLAWVAVKALALAWPHFWRATNNRGLVTHEHCAQQRTHCRQGTDQQLEAGDERLDVLSKGVAFLLRQIPALCAGVGAPGCEKIKQEANRLADEMLLAGKTRVQHRDGG